MWFTGPDSGRDYFDEDWKNKDKDPKWLIILVVIAFLVLCAIVL